MQINVQAVLVSDGTLSFAIFLYDRLNYLFPRTIGFDSGDAFHGAYYLTVSQIWPVQGIIWHSPEAYTASNPMLIFRVDGM